MNEEGAPFRKNPVWQVINDPAFAQKCENRDPGLLAKLKDLSAYRPERLGELAQEAFANTTDQRSGKFIRSLSRAMTELAVGEIVHTIFSHCEISSVQE